MANPWFKLYGVEMMADPKFLRLSSGERSCWLTLLCLASMDNGVVRNVEESYLMTHSGISPNTQEWSNTHGILLKLEMLSMITMAKDQFGINYIVVKNWEKRQAAAMTGYERLKKHRAKAKLLGRENQMITDDNIYKNRVDKNREHVPAKADFLNSKEIEEVRLDSEGNVKPPKAKKDSATSKYSEMCDWLRNLTGAPVPNMAKQFKHLADAKKANISPSRLKQRGEELWAKDFYRENGMDFGAIVSSFNRKA